MSLGEAKNHLHWMRIELASVLHEFMYVNAPGLLATSPVSIEMALSDVIRFVAYALVHAEGCTTELLNAMEELSRDNRDEAL